MDPVPEFVRHEIAVRARYPGRVDTPAGVVRFRRSRWEHLSEFSETRRCVTARARLGCGDGDRMALPTLREFKVAQAGMLYWQEFFQCADDLSQQAGARGVRYVGALTLSGWRITGQLHWSPVLGSRQPSRRARRARGLRCDVERSGPKHAIAVLLADPDDGQDDLPETALPLGDFDRRQAALVRLYKRVLGFRLMPARDGRPDSMWRPRADLANLTPMLLGED